MDQTKDAHIQIRSLYKTFPVDQRLLRGYQGKLDVLKGVDLDIFRGEIFGIAGFSGAGKSTLVRCINRLEEPDSGSVKIDGVEITTLPKAELNARRRKIGMIFQTFNLFESKTVYSNIAYALRMSDEKFTRKEEEIRVMEMLELVGLTDKRNSFPGELSGGQKQRVGIARALINKPDILLSDEATSALDPKTTLSVLDLLRSIRSRLNLTILLITHELDVIRYVCDRMAILEEGEIREQGSVREVFLNPNSETGRIFLQVNENFQKKTWVETEGDGI